MTLIDMGARIVAVGSESVVAATGVYVSGCWLGNRLEVEVAASGEGAGQNCYTLTITGTKLDYITPNTCRRDLSEFRSASLFEPRPSAASEPGDVAEPTRRGRPEQER